MFGLKSPTLCRYVHNGTFPFFWALGQSLTVNTSQKKYCIVLYCIVLYWIESYGILCYLMVSNSIAWFCVVGFSTRAVFKDVNGLLWSELCLLLLLRLHNGSSLSNTDVYVCAGRHSIVLSQIAQLFKQLSAPRYTNPINPFTSYVSFWDVVSFLKNLS